MPTVLNSHVGVLQSTNDDILPGTSTNDLF
jgi:hypothetical protein